MPTRQLLRLLPKPHLSLQNHSEIAAKSKPPLAPPKAVPPRLNDDLTSSSSQDHKSGPSSSRNVAGSDVDPNDDDWDEDDVNSPPKAKGRQNVQTGSQADNNWLDEDFDD